ASSSSALEYIIPSYEALRDAARGHWRCRAHHSSSSTGTSVPCLALYSSHTFSKFLVEYSLRGADFLHELHPASPLPLQVDESGHDALFGEPLAWSWCSDPFRSWRICVQVPTEILSCRDER